MKWNQLISIAIACVASLALPLIADIPAHPSTLTFDPLEFEPPAAADYRHELSNGVPVYLAPDHEFPLVTISFSFKGGAYLQPADQTGLADAVGSQMRRGGTETVSADDLDEKFDFLAADVSAYVGSENSGASINCLTSNLDEAFALFMDMVRRPGFDERKLEVHKDQVVEQLRQRNDSPFIVMQTWMGELLYGSDHIEGRQPTEGSIRSISPESMRSLHAQIFHPGNLIISATGDFEINDMLDRLDRAMSGWEAKDRAPDPPAPMHDLAPGMYHADCAQEDLPAGTTALASRGITRDDPDAIPMAVMNHILGGGGFTSRVTNRVRSDEGLAYAALTFLEPRTYYPGTLGAFFQSKNSTVALATKIIFEEIEKIRVEPVTDEELKLAQNAFIEPFPQRFASKRTMLGVFVNDEMTNRPKDYWQTYRDKVRAVSKGDVQRVAQEHLHSDKMMLFIVGDWEAIYPGDLDGRAKMSEFFEGNVSHLPVRDPLTLEPVK